MEIAMRNDSIVRVLKKENRPLNWSEIMGTADNMFPGIWNGFKNSVSIKTIIYKIVREHPKTHLLNAVKLKSMGLSGKYGLVCLTDWVGKVKSFPINYRVGICEVGKHKMKKTPVHGTIATGDNLVTMRELDDACVDLVYLDPPYNSGANYKGSKGTFKDKWGADDINDEDIKFIEKNNPAASKIIDFVSEGTKDISMKAYLIFMTVRIMELHRILKNTGSIYLHVDSTSSHYLKLIMDAVFSRKMFRREIIWATGDNSGFKGNANNWIRGSDTVLYYTKSKNFTFNKQYNPHQEGSLKGYSKTDEDGRKYKLYSNKDGSERSRVYLDKNPGVPMSSVWDDINSFQTNANSPEFEDYPTQKPLSLLKRIIKASSNENDMVFDPFMGSGSTLIAARDLDRQWFGCDKEKDSALLVKERLEKKEITLPKTLFDIFEEE